MRGFSALFFLLITVLGPAGFSEPDLGTAPPLVDRSLCYSRLRDLDLQDGGGGLRSLGVMAQTRLKERYGRTFDFKTCATALRSIE